jgi:hypothetical protein
MRVGEDALVLDARAVFRGLVEIPLPAVRKAVVDDGRRWGYVGRWRFPVFAMRSSGYGTGALSGPLWSFDSSLMPEGCPVAAIDPVPAQAPNLALILEPAVAVPNSRAHHGHGVHPASIVGLLLRAEEPEAARLALSARIAVGDLDLDDLDYLTEAAREERSSRRRRPPPAPTATAPP